jgi:superfamily I DNA and/or RNA helicase
LSVDHVFLDEAGYANIIKALTVFGMNTPVTFLGDHLQLPPVCEINDQDIERNPEYRDVFVWAQSAIYLGDIFTQEKDHLVSRYLQHDTRLPGNMGRSDLTQTFRFDKKLAEILNRHVYKNGFTSSLEKAETEIYFIHAEKHEPAKSRISQQEVQAIQTLLKHLNEQEEFIILTPYRKQVAALGDFLPKERNDLKILTVHGSQGREWHTVILSVVDTGDKWFVDSLLKISNGLNLLNTAVSRAKNKLFIVCDTRYWKHQPGQLITDLLADAHEFEFPRFA